MDAQKPRRRVFFLYPGRFRRSAKVVGYIFVVLIGLAVQTAGAQVKPDDAVSTPTGRKFNSAGEPLTTLAFPANQKIDLYLLKIKQDTGANVSAVGTAQGATIPGPAVVKDLTVQEAMQWLKNQGKDWEVWEEKGEWFVADRATYEKVVLSKQVVQRVIRPQNIPAAEARQAVERMLTPNIGQITHDERTNQVIVTDLLPVVEAIERTIKLLDQKVVTRVFTIKHADPQTVLDMLQEFKSPPGRLELDPRMRQIIAIDTYENIQRMEVMVDILDKGPELRVYNLNNVDFEGQSIQDLQDYLDQEILTEGAYIKFDLQNGVMLLRDLPSVHEVVEKILEAVDQPAQQVYIEAEIVQTGYEHNFDYSIDYTIADDLLEYNNLSGSGSGGNGNNGNGNGGDDGTGLQPTSDLGFRELAGEFDDTAKRLNAAYPVFQGGAAGVVLDYVSRHVRLNFNAVMSDTESRLLAQPRVLVKNRQPVTLTDGGTISYPSTTYYGGGYGGFPGSGFGSGYVPSVSANSVPTGLTLDVESSIMKNGLIEMRVSLSVVDGVTKTAQLNGQDYTLVDTRNQTLDTVLIIPDGQTRMMGGMIDQRESETVSGIPFLKDIPVLGPLAFGSRSRNPIRRTLLMFITATVVNEKVRQYAEGPDDDVRTAPTFYEEASWSAAAIKRAVEAGLGEIGRGKSELPQPVGQFDTESAEGPGPEAAAPRQQTGRPLPPVLLSHEPTTSTTEKAPLRTDEPADLLPPPLPLETVISPEAREGEGATTETKSPVKPVRPTPKAIEPRAMSPRDLPLPPDFERAALPSGFPTTGSALVSEGPPPFLVGSRRPSDIDVPKISAEAATTETEAEGGSGLGYSSYDIVVVGPDGRSYSANTEGERRAGARLGTVPIPVDTLATVATPSARRTPVTRRTPIRRTPIRRTPIRATPPGAGRTPTPAAATSGARRTPTPRGYRPPSGVGTTTSYGPRPGIYPRR